MFQVNGIEWYLRTVEPLSDDLMRSDGSYTCGVTDNMTKTVYISSLLTGGFLDKVICHELCHVFSFSYELHIPIKTEEIIADFLATYGRDVFDLADELLKRFIRVA